MHCHQDSIASNVLLDKRQNSYLQLTASASLTQAATTASVRYVIVAAGSNNSAISACLISIIRACVEAINAGRVTNRIIVVCDACNDATADIARHLLQGYEHLILEHSYQNVGQARAAGAQAARLWSIFDAQRSAQAPSDRTLQPHFQQDWYAFTDIETCVSPDWLERQAQHHDAGIHAALGIRLSTNGIPTPPAELSPRHQSKVKASSRRGASLGIRGDYYWLVGGFDALPAHEDQQLLLDLEAMSANVVRDPNLIVTNNSYSQEQSFIGASNDSHAFQNNRNHALHDSLRLIPLPRTLKPIAL